MCFLFDLEYFIVSSVDVNTRHAACGREAEPDDSTGVKAFWAQMWIMSSVALQLKDASKQETFPVWIILYYRTSNITLLLLLTTLFFITYILLLKLYLTPKCFIRRYFLFAYSCSIHHGDHYILIQNATLNGGCTRAAIHCRHTKWKSRNSNGHCTPNFVRIFFLCVVFVL